MPWPGTQLVGALPCAPEVCRFDSLSGHTCRLPVQSLVGMCLEWKLINISLTSTSLSLSPLPSSSLSKVSKHILGLGFSKIIRNNSCPQVVRIYGDVIKETKVFLFHSDNHETFFVKIASLYNFSEIAFSFYMS